MIDAIITEDTFTDWTNRKINTSDAMRMDLLEELAEIFIEKTSEKMPDLSGSLIESAEEHIVFTNNLEATNVLITWTGEDNPNKWEFAGFGNVDEEDYALPNYFGEYYQPSPEVKQPNKLWVERTLSGDFNQKAIEDFLGKHYLQWLIGKL